MEPESEKRDAEKEKGELEFDEKGKNLFRTTHIVVEESEVEDTESGIVSLILWRCDYSMDSWLQFGRIEGI